MRHTYTAVPEGDGYNVVDETGEVSDWIPGPRTGRSHKDDTNEYVILTEKPEQWPPDMLWVITNGTRVRQAHGIHEGRVGTIVGQARSRKADRIFAAAVAEAASKGVPLSGDAFEILIDNEGPVVQWDDGPLDWFPGQALGSLEPIS